MVIANGGESGVSTLLADVILSRLYPPHLWINLVSRCPQLVVVVCILPQDLYSSTDISVVRNDLTLLISEGTAERCIGTCTGRFMIKKCSARYG